MRALQTWMMIVVCSSLVGACGDIEDPLDDFADELLPGDEQPPPADGDPELPNLPEDLPDDEATARSADGCTAAPYGYVCGVIKGKKKRIETAHVSRGKLDAAFICDYQGSFQVYNQSGRRIDYRVSGRNAGCSIGRAWFDWSVHKTYPSGTKTCVSFFERGERQGRVCFKLKG